jgi:SAM-dependent methyltransferase
VSDNDHEMRSRVADVYGKAFRQHGRSVGSLLIPKGRQNERFAIHASAMHGRGFSVLDFGCGFGDLKTFLDGRFEGVSYTGVDLMADFIQECQIIHGAGADFRQISSVTDIVQQFDYVIVCGTFNTLYADTREKHWEGVRAILRHLFALTRRVLSFDFMTDAVDYQAAGAFHLSPLEAYRFASQELSPRAVLNQSYMPYEYAVATYKDATILRPENLYRDV